VPVNCSWCEERFEGFLDGVLAAGERAHLVHHVDACDDCRALLEELRVVDALLLTPRTVELATNFTFATMAELRSMPLPRPRRLPVNAYVVSYLVAAWSLIGASFLIAPTTILAAGETTFDVAHNVLVAAGGLGHVAIHLGDRGDVSSWTTVAGGVLIADAAIALALVFGLRAVRPRIAQRLRW
jgi:hypothetical protein